MTRPCQGWQWAVLVAGHGLLLVAALALGQAASFLPLVLVVGLSQADRYLLDARRRKGGGALAAALTWGDPVDEASVTSTQRWMAVGIHLALATALSALWATASLMQG
jgi:hypothetical protein